MATDGMTMADDFENCPFCKRNIPWQYMTPHKSHCRKMRGSMEPMVECAFNSMHVIPISERKDHLQSCPDRHYMPVELVEQELAKVIVSEKAAPGTDDQPGQLDNSITNIESPTVRNLTSDKLAYLATFNSLPPMRRLHHQAYNDRRSSNDSQQGI